MLREKNEFNHQPDCVSGDLRIDMAPGRHVAFAGAGGTNRADTFHHFADTDDIDTDRHHARTGVAANTLVAPLHTL